MLLGYLYEENLSLSSCSSTFFRGIDSSSVAPAAQILTVLRSDLALAKIKL